MKIKEKLNSIIAIVISICLIVPTLLVISNFVVFNNSIRSLTITDDDKRVAGEISNMTGITTEEILKLKTQGNSWNGILDTFRNKIPEEDHAARENRLSLLSQNGLKYDITTKLKEEGFNEVETTQAKMLIDRVMFQLKEISSVDEDTNLLPHSAIINDNGLKFPIPNTDFGKMQEGNKEGEDVTSLYIELHDKIDIDIAIYLTLKLKNDFGGIEKVLDEYLYTLQVEISLETYLQDKQKYEKQKAEKNTEIDPEEIITLAKIEAKMLDMLQKKNVKGVDTFQTATAKDTEQVKIPSELLDKEYNIPKLPLPDFGTAQPKDPRSDIMNEINDIRNKSLNIEGR